jgi:hypothetical protein
MKTEDGKTIGPSMDGGSVVVHCTSSLCTTSLP